MTTPDVSVVIPSHDRADLVGRAITSVLDQEGCDIQVLVVDDGSTDDTPEVLDTFGDRIVVIRTDGIERGAARNLGARAATASVLAFLDSDDYWAPGKAVRQLDLAREGVTSVTGVRFEDARGRLLRTYVAPSNSTADLVRENRFLAGPSSLMIPKQTFVAVGGFPEELDVQGTEDWLFFMKLYRGGHPIRVIRDPLTHYRVHGSNFTSDPVRVASCMWAAVDWMVERDMVSAREEQRLRARTAVVIARQFAWRGRGQEAKHWLTRAFAHGSVLEATKGFALVVLSALKAFVTRIRTSE